MTSLKVKFAVTTIVIVISSFLIAFLISNSYYQRHLKPENDEKNTQIALQIVTYAEGQQEIDVEDYIRNIAAVGYQLYLVDENGNGKFYGNPFRDTTLSNATINQVLRGEIYHGMLVFPQETFVTGFFANELKNTIGVPMEIEGATYALFMRPNIKLLFNEMHILLGWLLALTILLCMVFVAITSAFLVDPISKLTKATNELSKGNFSVQLDIERKDEIGELAHSFTHMAKELRQLDEMKNEFISNITHDIQSPLSTIKGYTNLLSKDAISENERNNYIQIINHEINQLSNLTKELLLLASLDRMENIVKMKPFQLSEQIKNLILNYQWRLNEKGIMISYTIPEVSYIGDAGLLYTVWDNLISNGIKYNKENGLLKIAVVENQDVIDITISDSGIGIADEHLERIFERFYRVDSARTRSIEGTGLGLSIVATIVKLHDGIIRVQSKIGEGTTMTVSLPKHNKSNAKIT